MMRWRLRLRITTSKEVNLLELKNVTNEVKRMDDDEDDDDDNND